MYQPPPGIKVWIVGIILALILYCVALVENALHLYPDFWLDVLLYIYCISMIIGALANWYHAEPAFTLPFFTPTLFFLSLAVIGWVASWDFQLLGYEWIELVTLEWSIIFHESLGFKDWIIRLIIIIACIIPSNILFFYCLYKNIKLLRNAPNLPGKNIFSYLENRHPWIKPLLECRTS